MRSRQAVVVLALAVLLATIASPGAQAGEVRVLCSNAIKGAMEKLVPDAERAIGHRLVVQFGSSAALRRTIDKGEKFDLAILTPQVLAELGKAGRIVAASQTDIAQARLGVGMREGAPRSDISTPDAIRRRLLAAKSVTYSREGASNAAIAAMLSRLGIAAEMNVRTVLQEVSGRPAESVAEGANELVFAPTSEIVMVRGVEVLGEFPEAFQQPLVMTAALGAGAANAAGAKSLVAYLLGPAAAPAMKAAGMTAPR